MSNYNYPVSSHIQKLGLCLVIFVASFVQVSCSGTQPKNVGTPDDGIPPCPDSSNCVSTFEKGEQRMEPISYSVSSKKARRTLKKAIKRMGNATLQTETKIYLHYTFRTTLGFVDDVEFLFARDDQVIHFRSASRIGEYDFGKNRSRMKTLKRHYRESGVQSN